MKDKQESILYEGTNKNAPELIMITYDLGSAISANVRVAWEGGYSFKVSYEFFIPINEEEE